MLRYLFITLIAGALCACATAPDTHEDRVELQRDAEQTLQQIRLQNPEVDRILADSYGYAVFPTVGEGAAIVGGGYGRGIVYERGRRVGYADVTQLSAGLQLGGQTYTEVIAFQDRAAMERFKSDDLVFDARASAVVMEAGATARAPFHDGVAVFVFDETGLMGDLSLAGQRYTYQPRYPYPAAARARFKSASPR